MHEFDRGVTKYDIMPIPPVAAQSQRFEMGPVSVWVEYRLLDDVIAAAHTVTENYAGDISGIDDRGVSLHVFGPPVSGSEPAMNKKEIEYLRFDCFEEDPHYHYVSYERQTNEMVHLDAVAHGDPLEWALDCVRTRLPQMLQRAGAAKLASLIDLKVVEEVLPKVAAAAYQARFAQHDDEAIRTGSLAQAAPVPKSAGSSVAAGSSVTAGASAAKGSSKATG